MNNNNQNPTGATKDDHKKDDHKKDDEKKMEDNKPSMPKTDNEKMQKNI